MMIYVGPMTQNSAKLSTVNKFLLFILKLSHGLSRHHAVWKCKSHRFPKIMSKKLLEVLFVVSYFARLSLIENFSLDLKKILKQECIPVGYQIGKTCTLQHTRSLRVRI